MVKCCYIQFFLLLCFCIFVRFCSTYGVRGCWLLLFDWHAEVKREWTINKNIMRYVMCQSQAKKDKRWLTKSGCKMWSKGRDRALIKFDRLYDVIGPVQNVLIKKYCKSLFFYDTTVGIVSSKTSSSRLIIIKMPLQFGWLL